MSSSSTVTYTTVYTDFEPGRPVAPPSPEYVPGPEHPPSPDYVPGPEHPPSPVKVPYVPEPEYPEYLVPSDAETLIRTRIRRRTPRKTNADYPPNGGDNDDDPSNDDNDDDDTDDEDEEPFKDEDDDEEEDEHLALTDSSTVPVVDLVPSARDIEAFETDEFVPTPRSPQTKVPFSQTRLCRVRKTVRLKPPMSPSMEARIAEYVAAPTPPSPLPSPLSPWSSPLPQIPSPPLPPPPSSLHLPPPVPTSLPLPFSPLLPLPASLSIPPPVDRREDIHDAELLPRKRLCLTTPTLRYEVEESSTAAPRPTRGHRADYVFIGTMDAKIRRYRAEKVGYGIKDVWVYLAEAVEEVASTTLEGVNARVTELAATQLSQRVDVLIKDRQFHHETALLLDQEALASREAWTHSVGLSSGQVSAALGQIQALQARDQTHADDPEGASSSV
ncbi:hypothetical protein Tco_0932987 [Tanacetum coccineum]